jgi:hypothetical protein
MTGSFKIIAAIFVAVLLLDNILPTRKIITEVSYQDNKSSREISYFLPGTGGDTGSCEVPEADVKNFPLNTDIVVERTMILNRCIEVYLNPGPIDSAKFIDATIKSFSLYGDNYKNLEELRIDYPGFTPRVRLWAEDDWTFGEINYYSVNIPEYLVIYNKDGTWNNTRKCGFVGGNCQIIAPAHPEKGIVGTLQYGEPTYAMAENFELEWQGDPKAVFFKSGHCFSAYSQSPASEDFIIRLQGAESSQFMTDFGFFLLVNIGGRHTMQRISKAQFIQLKSCSREARAAWPDIGWSSWKR